MGWNTRGKRKGLSGKKSKFNPGHNDVAQAVKIFLKKGGKIKKLEPTFCEMQGPSEPAFADEFLLGK